MARSRLFRREDSSLSALRNTSNFSNNRGGNRNAEFLGVELCEKDSTAR